MEPLEARFGAVWQICARGLLSMSLTRREALAAASLLMGGAGPGQAQPFSPPLLRRRAAELARLPFKDPRTPLPPELNALNYDAYRAISFRPEQSLWANLPFRIGLFARGFLYERAVELFEVADGVSIPITFSPDMFDTGGAPPLPAGLGFAGFRVHAAINQPEQFDEFCVFLGASYFRAVGRNTLYGLSARGLAIGTGRPEPEEFPFFRSFWLERPRPGATALVIYALLDSPSVAGAYHFLLRPGQTTTIDVECTLIPRVSIPDWGVAPLTSMYLFSPRDSSTVKRDDWRTAVHDSDGLAAIDGSGQAFWRPLTNPPTLQFTEFNDSDLRGFGLLQRERSFEAYGDLQVPYERRPSAWVEPVGAWSSGALDLVEIPTTTEYNDNIVAFWRGREPLGAGSEYQFTYRLHWGENVSGNTPLARLQRMRTGGSGHTLLFVLDFAGDSLGGLSATGKIRLLLSSTAGVLREGYSGPNGQQGGWRISLEFDPLDTKTADLSCTLVGAAGTLAESWRYHWTI